MSPNRLLTVALAVAAGLSGCRSTAKRKDPTPPPAATATATPAPKAKDAPIALAPWAPAQPLATSDAGANWVPIPAPSIPIAVEPPPESTELRPCVPAPALPGSPYYWLSSSPGSPVAPATAPAVPAGPLSPSSRLSPAIRPAPAPTVEPTPPRIDPPVTPIVSVAPVAASWPATAPEFFAELRRRAASGQETDLASLVDLLDAVIAALPAANEVVAQTRLKDIEEVERERVGRGLAWATISTYVQPDADATAMRAAYLDFDRVGEYTGKPGTKTLGRVGDVTIGKTDAIRKLLTLEFGARWTFRAKSLDRGGARIIVTTMADAPDTSHMVATRGFMIAFPTRRGLLVAEANASLVDFEVPGILKGTAESMARKETLARINGMRTHWREYVK